MYERNYEIDFWKFIFSIVIVIYHAWSLNKFGERVLFPYGCYIVDFFFIVSSYLMMVKINTHENNEDLGSSTWKFIIAKLKPIFIYIILSFFVGCLFEYIFLKRPLVSFMTNIFELLQMQMNGVLTSGQIYANVNRAEWYISSMLFVFLIIYPLACKYKKTYSKIIAPIFVFLTCSFIIYNNIGIYAPFELQYLFINGTIRAFLSMNIGVIAYEIVEILKKFSFKKLSKLIFTIVEIGIVYVLFHFMEYGIGEQSIFLIQFLTAILVIIIFSKISFINHLFKHSIWQKLSKFGFIMYLNHMYIRNVLAIYNFSYNKNLIILISTSLIISIITSLLAIFIQKIIQSSKFKKLFLN